MLVAIAHNGRAGGFSYVYIQGDKNTPFYVKFEDQMLPRYGKNYSIIPQLAPGPINIQVLFQQNMFPAQKFTIMVPEDGFRGFILFKKGDAFALYDIQQQFYLYPGNRPEDDRMPQSAGSYVSTYRQNEVSNNWGSPPAQPQRQTGEQNGPRFMSNIELNGERPIKPTMQNDRPVAEPVTQYTQEQPASEQRGTYSTPAQQPYTQEPAQHEVPVEEYDATPQAKVAEEGGRITPPTSARVLTNSDCPGAMSDGDFEDLYSKTQSRPEKAKLKFLLSKMSDCYDTRQVRALAEVLGNDPERYTFLKRVYPRVSDQGNFPALENMLSTQEWKDYFNLILPKQ